jgi:hypothetical protein
MDIKELLSKPDFGDVIKVLCVDTRSSSTTYLDTDNVDRTPSEYIAEYKGERKRRPQTGVDMRLNKSVDVYSETETDADGNPKKLESKTVFVAKVKTTIPKKIVRIANAFLFGGDMRITANDQNDAFDHFKQVFEDELKMKSVFSELAKTCMIETKSAIIFYPAPYTDDQRKQALKVRCMVLSNKLNEFYPHFDDYGDMDAFTRKYKAVHDDGDVHEFIWIQTAEQELKKVNIGGVWTDLEGYPKANPARKITVVYVEQDMPEWEEVAVAMDYYENRISRLVDTNDYFADPILKTYGDTKLPSKETVGKVIEFDLYVDPETQKEVHGDADYLAWQQSVESVKLELDTLRNEIHAGTSTPDISLENLKSLGNITGIGIKMMFLDAFIKASEKRDAIFDKAVQRSVSIVKTLISEVTTVKFKSGLAANRISVDFGSVLPEDLKELMDILAAANGNKPINSQETITAQSPFTKNAKDEMALINEEANAESSRNSLIGSVITNNP